MSEILLRLRVEGATHSSLWNTRWKRHAMEHNTSTAHRQVPRTLRASGSRRMPISRWQKAAGAAAAELPLPLGERPLGGLAIASTRRPTQRRALLVLGASERSASCGERARVCGHGRSGQARDISPSSLRQLQRVQRRALLVWGAPETSASCGERARVCGLGRLGPGPRHISLRFEPVAACSLRTKRGCRVSRHPPEATISPQPQSEHDTSPQARHGPGCRASDPEPTSRRLALTPQYRLPVPR